MIISELEKFLIGWHIKLQWEDGEIEQFEIVSSVEPKNSYYQIRNDSALVQSLSSVKVGNTGHFRVNNDDKYISYKLLEMTNPKLEECIKNRNLTTIYHYTQTANLLSILKNGIYSKSELWSRRIKFAQNDKERIDNKLDCINCSLEYPNNRLMFKEKINNNTRFCLIALDISVLREIFSLCCPTNAAKYSGKSIIPISQIENLFIGERSENFPVNYPTDEQAEILIKKHIPIKFIKAVIFENDYDYNQLKNSIPENVKCIVSDKLFRMRGNYE